MPWGAPQIGAFIFPRVQMNHRFGKLQLPHQA